MGYSCSTQLFLDFGIVSLVLPFNELHIEGVHRCQSLNGQDNPEVLRFNLTAGPHRFQQAHSQHLNIH